MRYMRSQLGTRRRTPGRDLEIDAFQHTPQRRYDAADLVCYTRTTSSGYSTNHLLMPPVKMYAFVRIPFSSKASSYHAAHLGPRPLELEQWKTTCLYLPLGRLLSADLLAQDPEEGGQGLIESLCWEIDGIWEDICLIALFGVNCFSLMQMFEWIYLYICSSDIDYQDLPFDRVVEKIMKLLSTHLSRRALRCRESIEPFRG